MKSALHVSFFSQPPSSSVLGGKPPCEFLMNSSRDGPHFYKYVPYLNVIDTHVIHTFLHLAFLSNQSRRLFPMDALSGSFF